MPITDYESENDRIKRMFAQALALRQDNETPQGKMVGGHFVAPSWAEQLSPAVNQALGGFVQGKAEKEQKGLAESTQQDMADWLKNRPGPKTTTTSEVVPDTEAPGPMPEGQFGPLNKTRMATETTQPTRDDQINWAGQGLKNPLSKALASSFMQDQMVQAPEREALRAWREEESKKARQSKLEQIGVTAKYKMDQLNLASADKTRSLESHTEIEKMKNQTKRDIAYNDAETRLEIAHDKLKAAGLKSTPVPASIMTKMTDAEQAADGITQAYSAYKPEYSGWIGGGGAAWAKMAPSMLSSDQQKEAATWWTNYEDQSALIRRHAMFGSAFTDPERRAWEAATITKTTPPELVATYLKTRAELSNKFFNRVRQQYTIAGHPAIGEAFQARPESFSDISGMEKAPTIPQVPQRQPAQGGGAQTPEGWRQVPGMPPGDMIGPGR
jgi:hypothetical protein